MKAQEGVMNIDERMRPVELAEVMARRWERLSVLYGVPPSAALDEMHKGIVQRAVRGEPLPMDPVIHWVDG